MKTKLLAKIIPLILVLIIMFSLTSCGLDFTNKYNPIESSKEEILEAIEENSTKTYGYVYKYLIDWGITGFDTLKVRYFEGIFLSYYNLGDGLPDTALHAEDAAKCFIENYYDSIDLTDYEEVTDAVLKCYVYCVGDAYSYYRTAEEFEDFEEDMSGTFVGVGVQIEYDHTNQTLMVNQVFKDGPADKGGMKIGDYIIGVDGKTLDDMGGYLNAVYYIRGEAGTEVTVKVDRGGEILDLTMTREKITELTVEYELTDEGYGYISINSFKGNTAEQFKAAVEALEDMGAVGYIFDVRSNPGGYVDSVVDIMSYILPTGKTVISYEYKDSPTEYDKTKNELLPDDEGGMIGDHTIDLPIVVLCNEYTASAGEIFVACLRDYKESGLLDDVVIVGETTFGKGIMQGSISYTDKSYVTLTVAYYNPPSGVNYHGIGIAPDVQVALGDTDDTQLSEAIRQMALLLEDRVEETNPAALKESILESVQASIADDPHDYDYVTQYLILWGVGNFDAQKLSYYENVFEYFYNFEDGLPETLTHAADTAKYFIENYYDTIDLTDKALVTDALLNCYVYATGDTYAYYRTEDQFADFEDDMSGTFGGIGVEIEYNHIEGTLLISRIMDGGPAAASEMKVGDYIIGVDGMTFEEMGGYANVVYYIRGEIGTSVTVTVDRNGEILDLTMTRAEITETLVDYHLTEDGYGYIRIASFKEKTFEQFQAAVECLEDLGAVGYIFDVRSNPGGYVYSVVDVMSYILPTGKTVISYEYKNSPTEYSKTGPDQLPEDEGGTLGDHVINLPIVVICDEYTASAGEIFVSCLRDYEAEGVLDDVVIVGKNTYGKGIMQGSVNYEVDNSYVTLTIAYYNPPSDVNYHGIGIAPDVEVELGETEDTQLKEAIEQMDLLLQSK